MKLIGKYVAQSDGGDRHVVLEYQEFIEVETKDGREFIPGMKEYHLETGGRVNWVDDDTFKIVQSGAILKRVR